MYLLLGTVIQLKSGLSDPLLPYYLRTTAYSSFRMCKDHRPIVSRVPNITLMFVFIVFQNEDYKTRKLPVMPLFISFTIIYIKMEGGVKYI